MARFWSLSVMVVFLIILDQLTKGAVQSTFYLGESIPIIDGFFNLTYVRNTGAAFGFMRDSEEWIRKILFLLIPSLVSIWVVYMWIVSIKKSFYLSLAYALIFAGAVGNLIDRFWLGFVVDFFDFYVSHHHFPAFNVADSCITVAAFILIIDMFFQAKNNNQMDSPK